MNDITAATLKTDKIPIVFSTVTGNAVKLANAAASACPHIGPYNAYYVLNPGEGSLRCISDDILNAYPTLILTYWCDLGSADAATVELIGRLKNKNLILLGSLGTPADGKHAEKVRERVESLAKKGNALLGHYLCRGSIDLARSERKRAIAEGAPLHLDEKGFARHLESQGHPDDGELAAAADAVKRALARVKG